MEYIEKAKREIKENWFKNHTIKEIEGNVGLKRISFGSEKNNYYQIDYILSGNMVFVSGDLGEAVYTLTCDATLENIEHFDLSYFTSKLSAHSRRRWDFNDELARKLIRECFSDWCIDESDSEKELEYYLDDDEKELYQNLIDGTYQWSEYEDFENMVVWNNYNQTNVHWFDGECASVIASCGQKLPYHFVAYWLGLQMIHEQLT